MVKLSTFVLFTLGSLSAAQSYDQWRKLCSSGENKAICQLWIDWVRGGQLGKAPQFPTSPNRPKPANPKPIITPLPKSTESPWQPQEIPKDPPPWQQSQPSQPKPTPTPPGPTQTVPDKPKNIPPPTSAPQQGTIPPPFEQAVCTVEIYSYTTKPEGLRTRTRTRTIIVPSVITITQLITTETTSIQVETIIQEQQETTITSSQTICEYEVGTTRPASA